MNSVLWNNTLKLDKIGLTLTGASRAATQTSFIILEHGIFLDSGMSTDLKPSIVLITHTHYDHAGRLPTTLMRNNEEETPVVVPAVSLELIDEYIKAAMFMTKHTKTPRHPYKYKLIPVHPREEVDILGKGRPVIKTYPSFHGIPCLSYGLIDRRRRLKKEYLGLEGSALGLMKKEGIIIDEPYDFPLLVYCGDTKPKIFSEIPEIFDYPYIITECTFLADEDLPEAKEKNHTHWTQLEPHITSHPNNTFVLIHFSAKYFQSDIEKFFSAKSDLNSNGNLDNVILWLDTKVLHLKKN